MTVESVIRDEIKTFEPDQPIVVAVLAKLVAFYEDRNYTAENVAYLTTLHGGADDTFGNSEIYYGYRLLRFGLS